MNGFGNKEIVQKMYEIVLNNKELDKSGLFVDKNYVEEFNNTNKLLFEAFPDIKFTLKDIFQDSDKVVTFYDWSGTHQRLYRNISPTHKKVTVEGISIYELKDGKITHNIAYPDKLSFFQQLGLISQDFLNNKQSPKQKVYFIDEFKIPKKSHDDFKTKLDYNRHFIKKIEEFVNDEVVVQINDSSTMINLITIAIWENQQSLDNAKKMVQKEYQRIGFNPTEFNQKHDIEMIRGIYSSID